MVSKKYIVVGEDDVFGWEDREGLDRLGEIAQNECRRESQRMFVCEIICVASITTKTQLDKVEDVEFLPHRT